MDVATQARPVVHRTAVTGSVAWKWRQTVWEKLEERWHRTKPGEVFMVRHGGADEGADLDAHEWVVYRKARPDARYGVVDEEVVPADWENCGPTCKPFKADGELHRRPNRKRNRGNLEDYCPSAGHRRNPEIPAHPGFPVEMLLAFILDDSPGSSATVEHAKKARVRRLIHADYS